MPQVIAAIIVAVLPNAAVFGITAAFGAAGLTYFSLAIGYAVTIGLGLLASSLFKPKAPRPEDVQTNVRSSIAPRMITIGEDKVGGAVAFIASKNGSLYKVIASLHGEAHEISEIWIDKRQVTPGAGGVVSSPPFNGYLTIQVRKGLASESHYADLTSVFPEWDATHKGNGVVSLFAKQHAVGSDVLTDLFPSTVNTLYRMVVKHRKMFDPTKPAHNFNNEATWEWTDTAPVAALWYLSNKDGLRLPKSIFTTPEALAITQNAINVSNALIPTLSGGSIKRWTCNGTFSMDERPADVIERILQSFDGRMVMTSDGGIGIEAGEWVEPTFTITESMITGFDSISKGLGSNETANVIRGAYRSRNHDYQITDCVPWENEADILERGEIAVALDLPFVRTHSQARRLAKLAYYNVNPNFVLSISCTIDALPAIGERNVIVDCPLFGINEAFKIQSCWIILGEGSTVSGLALELISTTAQAYAWNHLTEEKPEPLYDEADQTSSIPDVTGFGAVIVRENISGIQVPYVDLSWTNSPNASLKVVPQYKKTADATWLNLPTNPGDTSVRTPALTDNTSYDFRARNQTLLLKDGPFTTPPITINVVADQTAPGNVTFNSKSGGAGIATINWTAPSSANCVGTNFYRATTNSFASATLVKTRYHAPSAASSWTDGGLAPSTYYYWLKARNGSGVESATAIATGSIVVT